MTQSTLNQLLPKILAILPALLPSSMIYLVKPLTILDQRGLIRFSWVTEEKAQADKIADYDLVLFSRNMDEKYDFLLQEVVGQGIPYFYDLDDNFWELPLDSWVGRHHRAPFRLIQIEKYLKQATLVRVFNPILEAKIRDNFNNKVYCALAGIDTSLAPAERIQRDTDKLKITYVTGRGPDDPLYSLFIDDLKEILIKYSDQVEAVLFSGIPKELNGMDSVSETPIIYDYDAFIRTLATSGYDIGLAPLFSTPQNLSKTNTKFRDYGLCRIAGIYSAVDVYTGCVEPDSTGLLVSQAPHAWFDAIERLILDKSLRETIQENAFKKVVNYYNQEKMENEWLELIQRYRDHKSRSWLINPASSSGSSVNEPDLDKNQDFQQLVLGENTEKFSNFVRAGLPENNSGQLKIEKDGFLPFEENSFNRVVCYYYLESVTNLEVAIREVYRVCKTGGQVFIISRYSNQTINQSNPQYKNPINEHTFRYWTKEQRCFIPYEEYADAPEPWGLLPLNSAPLDFRPQSIEFFYTHPYSTLPIIEKRAARKKYLNVCDLIVGQFVIRKKEGAISMDEKNEYDLLDLPELVERRHRDRIEKLQNELDHSMDNANTLQAQVEQLLQERERLQKLVEKQNTNQDTLPALQGEEYGEQNLDLEQSPNVKEPADKLQANLNETALQYGESLKKVHHPIIQQLLKERSESYLQMMDDSTMFQNFRGYQLQLSPNLGGVSYIPFRLKFNRSNLTKISLGFYSPLPVTQGELGVEMVDDEQNIIRNVRRPAKLINDGRPLEFKIEPIKAAIDTTYEIRVFGKGFNNPVFLIEWELPYISKKVLTARWRRIFAAFEFQPE